jgi:DeoR/GlpR family transcriptional regulator of sugar metabolism/DNA-binding LacI/PurR family transcriptional regulator
MNKEARYKTVLHRLLDQGSMSTTDIHQVLGVTKETLRKDLATLEELGLIHRTYGKIRIQDNEKLNAFLKEHGLLGKEARLLGIEELLQTKDRIRISSLAKIFNVSQITIRKDLQELQENSTIIKNHGEVLFDRENSVRKTITSKALMIGNADEKIARRILGIIRPGQTIYLDDSPYSLYIAAHIPMESNIQILTPSPRVLSKLMQRVYKTTTILLPGRIHTQDNKLILHEMALDILESYKIGVAVFAISGCDGFACSMDHVSETTNLTTLLPLASLTILCLGSEKIKRTSQETPSPVHHVGIPTIFRDSVEILTDDDGTPEDYDQLKKCQLPVFLCGSGNMLRNLRTTSEKKVGFLYSVSSTSDAKTMGSSIENAINKHSRFTLIEMGVTDERQSIVNSVQAMKAEHIDFLVLYITNYETGQYITNRFSREHIVSISIDIALPNSTFFGVDNYHAGTFAGSHLVRFITARWNRKVDRIIIFGVQTAGPLARQRISGIIDELRGVAEIDDTSVSHFDFEMLRKMPGEQIAKIVLPHLGQHSICISFNEKTTFLMHSMVPFLPNPKQIVIIGHNYNERIDTLMKEPDSRLLGCVHFHPEQYGEEILELITTFESTKTIIPIKYSNLTWIGNQRQHEFS